MTQFNKAFCEQLRGELKDALKAIEQKHGVTITVGKMGYRDTNIDFKADIRLQDGDTAEMEALKRHLPVLGLTEADLDVEFKLGNDRFKLNGFKVRARKNPIQIKSLTNDGIYICSVEAAVNAITAARR